MAEYFENESPDAASGSRVHFCTIPLKTDPIKELEKSQPGWFNNTGNLLFSTAVWEQVNWKYASIGYHFDPQFLNDNADFVVISAANWLSEGQKSFGSLADRIAKLKVPVVMIGLGAQAASGGSIPVLPEEIVQLMRAVSEKSHSIGVRGQFTADVLDHYGIHNWVITGCPSLYRHGSDYHPVRRQSGGLKKIAVGSTGTSLAQLPKDNPQAPGVMQRDIYHLAYRQGYDVVFQSERPEIDYLITGRAPEMDASERDRVCRFWGCKDLSSWEKFLDAHGRVFYDLSTWMEAMSSVDFYIGSRLHGCITTLLAGTPACLLTHDKRTEELAAFAGIPSRPLSAASPLSKATVESSYADLDLDIWNSRYPKLLENYGRFLDENGVPHRLGLQ